MQKSQGSSFSFIGTALAFLLFLTVSAVAQQNPNSIVFTAGGALSFVQTGEPFTSNNVYLSTGTFSRSSYPAIALNADFRTSDRISLGACLSMQTLGFDFKNVPYPNYQYNSGTSPAQSWDDTYHRYNASARLLYYFLREPNIEMYLGARAGYTWWDRSSTNSDPGYTYGIYDEYGKIFPMPVSIQAVFGMRYFFSDNFGLTTEAGIGAPYALMLGVSIRFSN
jgi:hypothetical protein